MIFLLSKIAIFHSRNVANKSSLILKLYGISLAGCLVSTLMLEKSLLEAFYSLIFIFSLFILYMPFYYTVSSSVSVQTMVFIKEKGKGKSSTHELKNVFASSDVIRYKLESMANSHMIAYREGYYSLTRKGEMVARFFQFMKKIWRTGPGG